MSLLIDTRVLLWWLADDVSLSDEVKSTLDNEPEVYVSAATVWEIAIKQAIGKIVQPTDLLEHIRVSGFRELDITSEHAMAAGRLPLIHRDPFDRMLVAQARCEGMTLVTRDPHCQKYDVPVLAV
jgi:PIN domain nuclease of toxin-antitoxin system